MNEKQAVSALSALAHPHRLRIFRLLAGQGSEGGVSAGKIAEAVGISPTALTFHLKELEHASLATSKREGRYVFYALGIEGMRQLLAYLTDDCCRGRPELCGPANKKSRNICKAKTKA